MAFTPDQQAQVDIAIAIETSRSAQAAVADAKRAKLEAVRIAKEVLLENARTKPVDARDISAADITAFADSLVTYVNG